MMQSTGILFTSKTKPLLTKALDGTFALTLLAFDRIGPHTVEPWRITYFGPEAKVFWDTNQAALMQPGQPLAIEAQRQRAFDTGGRFGVAPEIHATVTRMALAPLAHQKTTQPAQTVREQLSNSEQTQEQHV
ncbi:MAG: hypothetical protein Q8R67_05245 [Rhodoferax sp.]|nr:hypothetical protein [Rhodoferax sp.]MDP3651072.1 hypothetical protein [Rhodoferax sp.]